MNGRSRIRVNHVGRGEPVQIWKLLRILSMMNQWNTPTGRTPFYQTSDHILAMKSLEAWIRFNNPEKVDAAYSEDVTGIMCLLPAERLSVRSTKCIKISI